MASRRRRKAPEARIPRLSRGRTPEQIAFDEAIEHAVEHQRMARTEAKRLGRIWTDLEEPLSNALVGRLERLKARGYTAPWQTKAYREARSRVVELAAEARKEYLAGLTEVVKTVGHVNAIWQRDVLQNITSVLNPDVAFKLPPMNVIRGAALAPTEGLTLVEWSRKLETSTVDSIKQLVNRGLIQGKSLPATTAEIRKALDLPKHQAETLARTASKHAASAGKEALYQANSDVVIGVVWISTLDGRTSWECIDLDGTTYKLGEGIRPPAHFNCRSEIGPLMRDPQDIVRGDFDKPVTQESLDAAAGRRRGDRAALGGPVKARTTYPQWLKQQPAAVQDRVLGGPTRGKLWRQGKVKIDQFTDDDHRLLTLDEIRARYGV